MMFYAFQNVLKDTHALHNDVLVNKGPHIQWSRMIIKELKNPATCLW